jgi:hypothetical protein
MDVPKPKNELQILQKELKSYNPNMRELINLISNTYGISSFEKGKKKQKYLKLLYPHEKVKILQTTLNILNLQLNAQQTKCLSPDWVNSIDQIIDQTLLSEKTEVLIFYLNAKKINNKSLLFSDYHDSARKIITDLIEKKFNEFIRRFGFPNCDKWLLIPRTPGIRDRDFFGSLRIINPKVRLINAMNRTQIIKQFFMTDILKNPGKCLNILFARTFPKIDYIPNNLLENKTIEVYQIYEKKSDSKYHLKNVTKRIDKMMKKKETLDQIKPQKKTKIS